MSTSHTSAFRTVERIASTDPARMHVLLPEIQDQCKAILDSNGGVWPERARAALAGMLASAERVQVDLVATEFARNLGYGDQAPEFKAVERLARIAEATMAGNDYHGPQHATHVLTNAMWLSSLLASNGEVVLDDRDRLKLLIAATAHDAAHDGTGNKGEAFRLERVAADIAAGTMRTAGCFTEDEVADVHALIMATEPMERRKVSLACQFAEAGAPCLLDLPEPMSRLASSPKLAVLAGILSDADLWSSVGAGIEENARQSERVAREMAKAGGKEYAGIDPAATKFFLDNIATETFASRAGSTFLYALTDLRKALLGDPRSMGFAVAGGGRCLGETSAFAWDGSKPLLEAGLRPEVMARINEALTAFNDGPAGGRIVRIALREGGGAAALAADGARLEISRSGAMLHYAPDPAGEPRLGDDRERGIAAAVVPKVAFASVDFDVRSVAPGDAAPAPAPERRVA